jgi:hypothetical protein
MPNPSDYSLCKFAVCRDFINTGLQIYKPLHSFNLNVKVFNDTLMIMIIYTFSPYLKWLWPAKEEEES